MTHKEMRKSGLHEERISWSQVIMFHGDRKEGIMCFFISHASNMAVGMAVVLAAHLVGSPLWSNLK